MKTEITISNIYYNPSLRGCFFRQQASNTLVELLERSAMDISSTLDYLDERLQYEELDYVEEDFYDMTVEELAAQYDIQLEESEEEDENDE